MYKILMALHYSLKYSFGLRYAIFVKNRKKRVCTLRYQQGEFLRDNRNQKERRAISFFSMEFSDTLICAFTFLCKYENYLVKLPVNKGQTNIHHIYVFPDKNVT